MVPNELITRMSNQYSGVFKEIMNILINHFAYSIKDINSYEELTQSEKEFISEDMFKYITHNFKRLSAIKIQCPKCNSTYHIPVDYNDLDKYLKQVPAQEAFSYIPAKYREMFISGICPECFDKIMSKESD